MDIDINLLDNKTIELLTIPQFFETVNYGKVKVSISINQNLPSHAKLKIEMHTVDENKFLSELYFDIIKSGFFQKNDYIYFWHFYSKYQNHGNGKKMLEFFDQAIDIIKHNSYTKIKFIAGELTYLDYEHWDKLVYMYSSFISNSSVLFDNKYTAIEFLNHLADYEKQIVRFRIYLE